MLSYHITFIFIVLYSLFKIVDVETMHLVSAQAISPRYRQLVQGQLCCEVDEHHSLGPGTVQKALHCQSSQWNPVKFCDCAVFYPKFCEVGRLHFQLNETLQYFCNILQWWHMRTMLKIVELWFPPETEKTTGHLISRKWRATQDPVVTKQFAICLPCQTPTGSTTCTARVRHGSKTEALASAHSPNLGSEPTQTYFLCLWWELASEMSSNEHEYPSQLGLSRADHKTKGTPLFPLCAMVSSGGRGSGETLAAGSAIIFAVFSVSLEPFLKLSWVAPCQVQQCLHHARQLKQCAVRGS
jgi:hypothetical protein